MAIAVGQNAPEFTLKDQSQKGRETFRLSRQERGDHILSAGLESHLHE